MPAGGGHPTDALRARGETHPAYGVRLWGRARGFPRPAAGGEHPGRSDPTRPIFDFLRSRGARLSCPFCGREDWRGWDELIVLGHVEGSGTLDRRAEAFPLTCANCGFVRLQSARVLDDPRGPGSAEDA